MATMYRAAITAVAKQTIIVSTAIGVIKNYSYL